MSMDPSDSELASPDVVASGSGPRPASRRGARASGATPGRRGATEIALNRSPSQADPEGVKETVSILSSDVALVSDTSTHDLPVIPAKRYFTIGEVGELCGVKPYVLRYWEQEFSQLRPMKRRGNRRYYQHHEVLLIRRIRELLYEQGFTISGARNQLHEHGHATSPAEQHPDLVVVDVLITDGAVAGQSATVTSQALTGAQWGQLQEALKAVPAQSSELIRQCLQDIRHILDTSHPLSAENVETS